MPTVTRSMFSLLRSPRASSVSPTNDPLAISTAGLETSTPAPVEPSQTLQDFATRLAQTEANTHRHLAQSEAAFMEYVTQNEASQRAFQQQLLSLFSNTFQPSTITPVLSPTPTHSSGLIPHLDTSHPAVTIVDPTPPETPLPPMRTSWFQDLPMNPAQFLNWSNLFFLRCMECELEPLCDRPARSFVASTTNMRLNTRLYARLMQCLGPLNSFTDRLDIAGEGLLLMQKIKKVYGKPNNHAFRMEQLAYFWNSLARQDKESVDDYYNRFSLVLSYLPDLPVADVRRRFLLTLGGEFSRFVQENLDNRLESKFIEAPWEDLLDLLRDIAAAYKLSSLLVPTATAFSMGYTANAITKVTTDAVTMKALEDENAALKLEKAAVLTDKLKAEAATAKKKAQQLAWMAGPDFYCHTHGFGKNASHTSATCNTKGPGHNILATATDMMGGSTNRPKPRSP